MKNRVVTGIAFILLGSVLALGPLYLFKVCTPMEDEFMRCFWTARAELGTGALIAVLGIVNLAVSSAQVRLGISTALVFTGILAVLVPTWLIGVCEMPKMNCHAVAAPTILVIGVLVSLLSLVNGIYLFRLGQKIEVPA